MNLQINIKNIRVNTISTLGSINVGKVVLADNRAQSLKAPKANYEENKVDKQDIGDLVPEQMVSEKKWPTDS
ncbi:hypothetical protein [Bacillus sp. AK128]